MGFIRALAEFAAATANLHPAHRRRFDDLVRGDRQGAVERSPADLLGGSGTDLSAQTVE